MVEEEEAPIQPGTLGSDATGEHAEAFTNQMISILYEWEDEEARQSRGKLDAEVRDGVVTWLGNLDPRIRAYMYSTIVLLAHVAPDEVSDVEIAVLGFGAQDHHAAKAVEDGGADPDWLGGQWGVTFDADWYDDNVHHGGSLNREVARGYLAELFGGRMEPGVDLNEGVQHNYRIGPFHWTMDAAEFIGPDTPNEAMAAVEEGLDVDRGDYPGLATGGDAAIETAASALDALAWVSQAALFTRGAVGTVQMGAAPGVGRGVPGLVSGYPLKAPFKNPQGRLPTTNLPNRTLDSGQVLPAMSIAPGNPAWFRNTQAIRALTRPAGTLSEAASKLPAWMRLPSYVSMRVGTGTQNVINNAAQSQYAIARGGGRSLNFLAGTRLRAANTVAAALVFGSGAVNTYALTAARGDTAEGRRQVLEENEERLAAAQVKAEFNKEENVIARETKRRADARALYESREQSEVGP